MKEGDVVMVVGNLDDRVRDGTERLGTVISVNKDDIVVLLSNGDLWKGHKREVVLQQGQVENE